MQLQGKLGRVAAAASLGLYVFSGMPTPAAASHRHHRENAEAGKPEAPKQPSGPLILAISISGQRVTVYDNGTPIASSQISTGMSGHPTPMGVFSVIQKQRWHHSNLYSNAPMPYMQRITWSGVALHSGVVPGYPASHGCIRLPDRFALRLWGMTKVGARVIIARGDLSPYEITHQRLAELVKAPEAAKSAGSEAGAVVVAATAAVTTGAVTDAHVDNTAPEAKGHPQDGAAQQVAEGADSDKSTATGQTGEPSTAEPPSTPKVDPATRKIDEALQHPGAISLFVSRREGKLFVRKGFAPVFDTPVTIAHPETPLGTHLFTASRPANDGVGVRWLAVSFGYDRAAGGSAHGKHKGRAERPAPMTSDGLHQAAADALDRIEIPQEALDRIIPLVTPGASLLISDQGLGSETGRDTDFIVVTK